MKTVGKATDLITFSRSSGGTALRKISYGPELVTNGTFDADTDWVKGSTSNAVISGGTITVNSGDLTNDRYAYQVVNTTAGKAYQLRYDVVSGSGGVVRVGNGIGSNSVFSNTSNSVGSYVETIIADASTAHISLAGGFGSDLEVDNISVKEVLFDQADGDLVVFNHPADIPRIEYAADGSVKGLLVEEARTNLHTGDVGLTYAVLLTKTANAAVAPDGTETASLRVPDPTSGVHRVGMSLAYSSGASNETYSAYLKAAGYDKVSLLLANQSGGYTASFDLSAGTITNTGSGTLDATIVDVGGGWYRCSMTYTATKTNPYPSVEVLDSENNATFTGDGTSGVYMWGHQIEVADFPTSYIPTSGATATRSADVASISTSAFGYRQAEGTLFVDGSYFHTYAASPYPRLLTLRRTYGSRESIEVLGINDTIGVEIYDEGAISFSLNTSGKDQKVAIAAKEDDFAISFSGGAANPDTSGGMPQDISVLEIGNYNGAALLNGHIKSLKYYPRRLTNAQLQELTT